MTGATHREAPRGVTGGPQQTTAGNGSQNGTTYPYREAASDYLNRGWRGVIPVGGRPGEKYPPPKGYTGREYAEVYPDAEQVAEWQKRRGDRNLALRHHPDTIALDVDAWGGKPGYETLQRIVKAHGPLPTTWKSTARADGKSAQWFYRVPVGLTWHDEEAVEVLHAGHRYSVVWPSIHDSGTRYQWTTPKGERTFSQVPRPNDLPELPAGWVEHFTRRCDCFKGGTGTTVTRTDPVADTLAKFIGQMHLGKSAHDSMRDGQLALVGMRKGGYEGAAEALERLRAAFIDEVTSRPSKDEGRRDRRRAEREWNDALEGAEQKANPAASAAAPADWRPWVETANADSGDNIPRGQYGHTLADILGMHIEPLRFVVADLIPEGLSVLAGKPKMGKSWMALGISLAVVAGRDALGQYRTSAAEVLYIGLEDGIRRMQERSRALGADRLGAALHRFHWRPTWPTFTAGGLDALEAWMEAHPDTRLIVIDTWGKVRGRETGKRTDPFQEDYDLLGPLQTFASKHRVAVVIVHHVRKSSAEDWIDELSGSVAFTAAADTLLGVYRERGQMDATLRVTGRDIDEQEIALKFEDGRWEAMGDAHIYRLTVERSEVLAAVVEFGQASPKELAEHLGKTAANVQKQLSNLEAAGEVVKVRHGVYRPTPPSNLLGSG